MPAETTIEAGDKKRDLHGKCDCTGKRDHPETCSETFQDRPEARSVTGSSAAIRTWGCATNYRDHRKNHGRAGGDGWPAAGASLSRLCAAPPSSAATLPGSL